MHIKKLLLFPVITAFLAACQSNPTPAMFNPQAPLQNTQIRAASAQTAGAFQVIKTSQGKYWPKQELLRTPGLSAEPMQERGRQQDPDVLACFGTALPASTDVCLHDAGAPATPNNQPPVLLIHGANVNATMNWATPPFTERKTGLMQHLKSKGFHVFAVTFANKHGDNHTWVRHIHNSIERIKQITKAPQVDAVAHSKGGFALRMYTSNIVPQGQAPYQKSVRKALFIGTPHRGLDYTFRNSVVHWALIPEKEEAALYAPVVWEKALIYGRWVDASRSNFTSPFFQGQAQMIYPWKDTYPIQPTNPDWYTTYNGGQGFVSKSPGIKKVMAAGGNLVSKMINSPVDPKIAVGVLAGNKPNMPGILNEKSGPSDGLVFVKSSSASGDLTAAGAPLLDSKVLPLHHMALVSEPPALDWVFQQLNK